MKGLLRPLSVSTRTDSIEAPELATGGAYGYVAIIPAEEAFLREKFPEQYLRYSAAVPRLVPRLRPWSGAYQRPPDWRSATGELHVLLLLVITSVLLWAGAKIRGF